MRKKVFWFNQVIMFSVFLAVLSFPVQALAMSEDELRLRALEEKMEARENEFSWLKKFKPKGDLRLRHEGLFRDADNAASSSRKADRTRERIRFRIGGEYFFTKDLKAGFRLATGSEDPVSTNQTFDDTFSTKDIRFDQGYAQWKYSFFELTGGKFAVPWVKEDQLLWDDDLNVEGAVEKFFHKAGDTSFELFLGQFPIEEFGPSAGKTAKDDPSLFIYQAVIGQKLGSLGKAKVAAGFFDYNALAGNISSQVTKGNTLDAAGNYAANYDILDFLAEFSTEMVMGTPVKIFGEYTTNTADRADNLENVAWQAGVKVGDKPNKLNDWQIFYLYRVLERDAVFDALSDSDFHEGGTNAKGSKMGLKYGLYNGVTFDVTYFITEAITGPKDDLNRLQLDLVFKLF